MILQVNHVTKSIKGRKILDDVSLNIREKEIVGLIGNNGAGKSTLMKTISTLIFADNGDIQINQHDILKARNMALKNYATMIEEPGFYPELSGLDNIRYFAKLKRVSQKRIDEVIQLMDLGESIKKKAGNYSLGMKQRLALGICFLSDAKLFVLDEPTNGLDPSFVYGLLDYINKRVESEGCSILISSHQLKYLDGICDRAYFLKEGKIVHEMDLKDLKDVAYIIKTSNNMKCVACLKDIVKKVELKEDECHVIFKDERDLEKSLKLLHEADLEVVYISHYHDMIERLYKDEYLGE